MARRRSGNSKALERAKNAAASARRRAKEKQKQIEHKAYVGASAFALGYAQKAGWIDKLPTEHKTALLAAGLTIGEFMTRGKVSDILGGASDAAIAIATYRYASGGAQIGAAEVIGATPSPAQLEAQLERALDSISGIDDDDDVGEWDDDDDVGEWDDDDVGEWDEIGADGDVIGSYEVI